jgi:hypothetical protein
MDPRVKRGFIFTAQVKSRDNGPLGKLWREVLKISKPIIAAYLAKLLPENAKHLKKPDVELKGPGADCFGLKIS